MSYQPELLTAEELEAIEATMADLGLAQPRLRCCLMPQFAAAGISKWAGKPVLCQQQLTLPGLTAEQIAAAWLDAIGNWNAVCGVDLRLAGTGRPNILAKSGGIDGASGTLAWSYLPGAPSPMTDQLAQLYDTAERWTYAFLSEVLTHEIGHGIGMPHSSDPNDIMYPYSHGGSIPKPQAGDVRGAVARYGQPLPVPTPTPTPGMPEISGSIVINGRSYVLKPVP